MTWNGKVGLVTASEYIRTSNNNACKSQNDYYNNNNSLCCENNSMHNWLHLDTWWWILSSSSEDSAWVFYVDGNGVLGAIDAFNPNAIRPALYLSSNLTLTGSGTMGNPYKIA